MAKVDNCIRKLKQSPLFALSLCGKELAHSNYWAWLIELECNGKHPFIEVFVPDFYQKGYEYLTVKREES